MIPSRSSCRAIMFFVFALFLCGARSNAFAETWEPVSTGFATDIAISTSGGSTSADVRLTCPNTGYRVADWGVVTRNDSEFSVDAKVERWTGPSAQMIITLAHGYSLGALAPGTYSFVFKAYASVVKRQPFTIGGTVPAAPRLMTEENTERAVALESVTLLRGPFSSPVRNQFNSDTATRVMLFATEVELSAVTAQAEDSQQRLYPLTVEYIGKAPNHDWLTQMVIKLPAGIEAAGDLWVSINAGSFVSNKVLISIKPAN